MSTLLSMQRDFQQALRVGDPCPGLFVGEDPGACGGLAIYLNAYRGRLIGALADNYPMLHQVVGDEAFRDLALGYLNERPSSYRSIRWFGDQLANWLADGYAALPHPALADLARMEWALRGVFDAGEAPGLTLQDLAALSPERWPAQRFRLRPAVILLPLEWQVEPLWQSLHESENADTEPPEPFAHTLLVWRPELDGRWRSLDPMEAAALGALAQGEDFAGVCQTLASLGEPQVAARAVGLLGQWISDGLLART